LLPFYQAHTDRTGRRLGESRRGVTICCLGSTMMCVSGALAQTPAPATTGGATPSESLPNLSTSSTLFGDMGGLRPLLTKYGFTLTLQEQSEVFGNVSGGGRQGFEYGGLTTATLRVDPKPIFGIEGGLFNVSALQIHGRNLSADNLLTLQTASGIEADPATRLWELWYQQKMFDDKFDVKIGQQSLDQEFMVSTNSSLFINASSGWPEVPTADMPGGPAYPLSALGVRGAWHPSDSVNVLAGIFNGSPVGDNVGDPQKQNPSGVSFPLNGGVLAIAELQFVSPPPPAADNKAASDKSAPDPLTYAYKIGFWYDSESFADLRFDTTGAPLASPASNGLPTVHGGDYAFYAVADQMVYRWKDDPDRNINVFVRPTFTPLQDRNLVSFSLNAGVTMREPIVGRKMDAVGVSVDYARVSNSAAGFAFDTPFFNPGVFSPPRRSETVIEATYQYQVTPWWQIQPDIQYVFNPGRWHRQSGQSEPEGQERGGARRAHEHFVLTSGTRSRRATFMKRSLEGVPADRRDRRKPPLPLRTTTIYDQRDPR
jgi:porin